MLDLLETWVMLGRMGYGLDLKRHGIVYRCEIYPVDDAVYIVWAHDFAAAQLDDFVTALKAQQEELPIEPLSSEGRQNIDADDWLAQQREG